MKTAPLRRMCCSIERSVLSFFMPIRAIGCGRIMRSRPAWGQCAASRYSPVFLCFMNSTLGFLHARHLEGEPIERLAPTHRRPLNYGGSCGVEQRVALRHLEPGPAWFRREADDGAGAKQRPVRFDFRSHVDAQ